MAKRILIVEDDPLNMKMMLMVLRRHGYDLLKASDGEEALEMVYREKPDLILMDIGLPKINGLEVTRRLRQRPESRHIPIIVVTAYAMVGDAEKAVRSGCDLYLTKPIDTRKLPEIVAHTLNKGQDNASHDRKP